MQLGEQAGGLSLRVWTARRRRELGPAHSAINSLNPDSQISLRGTHKQRSGVAEVGVNLENRVLHPWVVYTPQILCEVPLDRIAQLMVEHARILQLRPARRTPDLLPPSISVWPGAVATMNE